MARLELADLHLALGPTKQKGQGLFAVSDIAKVTLIVSEQPLFEVPNEVRDPKALVQALTNKLHELSKDDQRPFLVLSNNFPKLSAFHGIVKTNALPLGSDGSMGGIFPACSRFNHSCVFNAAYSWNNDTQKENVYALQDIRSGEEVTVGYLSETVWYQPKTERQSFLLKEHGFTCHCQLCDAPPARVNESDARRRRMAQLDHTIGDGLTILANPALALKHCHEILQLLREEGQLESFAFRPYYDAFQICVAHSDWARASAFIELSIEVKRFWQGQDSSNARELEGLARSPQSHATAGTTSKWATKLKYKKSGGDEGFEEWLWRLT